MSSLRAGEEPAASRDVDAAAEAAFDVFRSRLAERLGRDEFAAWGEGLRLCESNARRVRVAAPSQMHRARLESVTGPRVLKQLWAECDPGKRQFYLTGDAQPAEAARPAARRDASNDPVEHQLETFVVGDANRFAHTMMCEFADPSSALPVAYVHGDYGLGKTHLLRGVAERMNAAAPNSAVYFTGPRFVHEYVKALQERTTFAFRERARSAKAFIVDDIHLVGKNAKASHEELAAIVTDVLSSGGRVLFSGAGARETLTQLDSALVARLSGAVDCPLARPDLDLRRGILERMASNDKFVKKGLVIPPDVLDFIASAIATTPRDLQGGLNTVMARTVMMGEALSRDSAREALAETVARMNRRVTVEQIQKVVASFHGLTLEELLSKSRARDIVRPRQQAMFFARECTTRSYPDIGRRFGDMDHTTVLHGVGRIKELMREDPAVRADVESLRAILNDRRSGAGD